VPGEKKGIRGLTFSVGTKTKRRRAAGPIGVGLCGLRLCAGYHVCVKPKWDVAYVVAIAFCITCATLAVVSTVVLIVMNAGYSGD
jgi:hypothetical protein